MDRMPAIKSDFTINAVSAEKPRVTIIGTGNGGCALAADLINKGFHVCLYAHPDHSKKLDSIQQRGALISEGKIKGEFKPELLTKDMKEAITFADYILVAVPSFAQKDLFNLMAPHLTDQHIVVNLNGNFGSFVLLQQLEKQKPILAETNVMPHASRVSNDGIVNVLGIKKSIMIGSLPIAVPPPVIECLNMILPCYLDWRKDILEVALQSNNGVLHPAACILNAGWIESKKGDFYFYKDGMSPAVGRVIEQIDNERIEIGKRFGFSFQSLLDEMKGFYGGNYQTISDFSFNTELHNIIKEAPSDTHHRYISEDVPFALVPWYELGKIVGFEAKTMKSIIDLSTTMNGIDYMAIGRNLEKLGLAEMDQKSVLDYVRGASSPKNNVVPKMLPPQK